MQLVKKHNKNKNQSIFLKEIFHIAGPVMDGGGPVMLGHNWSGADQFWMP